MINTRSSNGMVEMVFLLLSRMANIDVDAGGTQCENHTQSRVQISSCRWNSHMGKQNKHPCRLPTQFSTKGNYRVENEMLTERLTHMKEAAQNAVNEKNIIIDELCEDYRRAKDKLRDTNDDKEQEASRCMSEIEALQLQFEQNYRYHSRDIREKDNLIRRLEAKKHRIRSKMEDLETSNSIKKTKLAYLQAGSENMKAQLKVSKEELATLMERLHTHQHRHKRTGESQIRQPKDNELAGPRHNTEFLQLMERENEQHQANLQQLASEYESRLKQLQLLQLQSIHSKGSIQENRISIQEKLSRTSRQGTIGSDPMRMSLRQQLSYLEYDEVFDPDAFSVRSTNTTTYESIMSNLYRNRSNCSNPTTKLNQQQATAKNQIGGNTAASTLPQNTRIPISFINYGAGILAAAFISTCFFKLLWSNKR